MSLTQLSPPAAEPVTLDEIKDHLRITHSDEDIAINGYLVAAVRAIEARAGLALMAQSWRLTLDEPPYETVYFPISPVSAINQVSVKNKAGDDALVDAATYEFAPGAPGRLRRAAPWPSPGVRTGGVAIDFSAGYAAADAIPADIVHAVKLLAAHFYEAREAVGEPRLFSVPQTVDALIAPYRQVRL